MRVLCTFTSKSSMRNSFIIFPMILFLFFVACSLVVLSPQSSYAYDGYLSTSGNWSDGAVADGVNNFPNMVAVGGWDNLTSLFPVLCEPYGGCRNEYISASASSRPRFSARNIVDASNNDIRYAGFQQIRFGSFVPIKDEWYGKIVKIYFYQGVSELDSSTGEYIHRPDWQYFSWGGVEFTDYTACDAPTAFSVEDSSDNDLWIGVYDFRNITSSQCTDIQPYFYRTANENNQRRALWANLGDYDIYWNGLYWAYDVVEPESEEGGELGDLVDSINDHWGEEIDIINDNKDSAESGGSAILNIFQLGIIDPFNNFWSLFVDDSCVNIPTIANMLHVSNPVYCSWWSSSVRSILTPVFTIGGTMLLWGFVINWLRNDGASLSDDSIRFYTKGPGNR